MENIGGNAEKRIVLYKERLKKEKKSAGRMGEKVELGLINAA